MTTIASDNQFVHLQIDQAGEFFSTIFPKGFVVAENEIGTENNDNTLLGLFNNNRLGRRKVIASVLLGMYYMTQTHRFKVDKLIRDKMLQIMRASGIQMFERVMEMIYIKSREK